MKPRSTLILLAAFLALLAYVYFGEMRRPASPSAATPAPGPLWDVAVGQVVALTIRSATGETRLSRPAGGEWRLEAPEVQAADTERVTRLLERLADLSPSRSFAEASGPLEEYGLAPPLLEVTLGLADGRRLVLKVGEANPQQTAYYAQIEGQPDLHLISDYLAQSLQEMLSTPPLQPTPLPAPAG